MSFIITTNSHPPQVGSRSQNMECPPRDSGHGGSVCWHLSRQKEDGRRSSDQSTGAGGQGCPRRDSGHGGSVWWHLSRQKEGGRRSLDQSTGAGGTRVSSQGLWAWGLSLLTSVKMGEEPRWREEPLTRTARAECGDVQLQASCQLLVD